MIFTSVEMSVILALDDFRDFFIEFYTEYVIPSKYELGDQNVE